MRGFVDFSLFSKRVAQVLFWEAPHFQNKFPARASILTKYIDPIHPLDKNG